MTSININHTEGTISTNDNSMLTIQTDGAVKIGNGTYLRELDNKNIDISIRNEYKGAIRYNDDRGCLQVCDGTRWKDIKGYYKQTSNLVWSLLF